MSNPSSKPDLNRIGHLILKSVTEELTPEENAELAEFISTSGENEGFYHKLLNDAFHTIVKDPEYARYKMKLLKRGIAHSYFFDHFIRNRFKYLAIAVSLLIIASASILFHFKTTNKTAPVDQVKPYSYSSSKGIILTLSNGNSINIDSVNEPITQGNVILKMNGDELTYIPVANTPGDGGFNTITTMGGKQFKVVFPDGSRAWLNAGTSIHYPTSFDYHRLVDITGEAYFEIAPRTDSAFPDNKVPFYVTANGMEISVKGTRFNVKAYENDEDVRTTLLDGSIKVKKREQVGLLAPGQQAVLSKGRLTINTNFDEEEVLAWKKNLFVFQNSAIEPLMHQIARWYNVTVVYDDVIMDKFTTTVPRNMPLEQLLKVLELSNPVHFRMEDNTVIVSK